MRIKINKLICLCITGLSLATLTATAGLTQSQPPVAPPVSGPPPAPPPGPGPMPMGMMTPPAIQVVSPGVVDVGGCKIMKEKGLVEFPASVNMNQGLLEYLIVGEGGKLHESLLRTEIQPYALQIALLLSGLEGTTKPISAQGDSRTPQGDPIKITLSWEDKGTTQKAAIADWVKKGDKPAGSLAWVFTGSVMNNGIFMAQTDKSIIAIYHDPVALIDHQAQEGASDEMWFANPDTIPPVGTKVNVSIEKIAKTSK